jgi:hypothetical protein
LTALRPVQRRPRLGRGSSAPAMELLRLRRRTDTCQRGPKCRPTRDWRRRLSSGRNTESRLRPEPICRAANALGAGRPGGAVNLWEERFAGQGASRP